MKKFILLTVLSLFISTPVWAETEELSECGIKVQTIMKKIEKNVKFLLITNFPTLN